ncbi:MULTISPECIES: helix-turn-helix domain-containing protein [Ensifer]|uniref:helix-turn-helix domain-containing protein n=1 Tax=Ensifer TaxID=106591 RepID=UPI0007124503|nr:hypothetical protein ASD01_20190 [Ensifer sp. Root423]KQX57167.1 hypothetical protein ASD49_22865 [Ensifer sp. Root1298]KQX92475.1 hypothetical protein ASD41_21565 [Ensifer sp. Root1312]KRC28345.1 hypothetical protein ASE29_19240 [Ensifer sp. Root74]KRD79097.1 hypothetical protein ASE71_02050 [Ensifer sp. Root954]
MTISSDFAPYLLRWSLMPDGGPIVEARVAAARRLLEQGQDAPKQVAARCGFADADTLRRAFMRHVGVTPAEYRKRFASPALSAD